MIVLAMLWTFSISAMNFVVAIRGERLFQNQRWTIFSQIVTVFVFVDLDAIQNSI